MRGGLLTPGRLTRGKDPVPTVQEPGWAPWPVWTGAEHLALNEIRSPDRPDRSQSLYRLSYTGPLLILQLTYSMEQNPSWEAKRFSASPEIPRILWNLKIHYRIHMCPPPVPNLSQLDPVHTPTSHFLNIQLKIIHPSMPGFPTWSLSLKLPTKILYRLLLSP